MKKHQFSILQTILFIAFVLGNSAAQTPSFELRQTSNTGSTYCFDVYVEGKMESDDFNVILQMYWDFENLIARSLTPNPAYVDRADFTFYRWSFLEYSNIWGVELSIENDVLFNVCFDKLQNIRSSIVMSCYLEGLSDYTILTKTDSALINPSLAPKTINTFMEQSDFVLPADYKDIINLNSIWFSETECLRKLEFDLLFDTTEFKIADGILDFGFWNTPTILEPIDGGYRFTWQPWHHGSSIFNPFKLAFKKKNNTPGKFPIYADNFIIENFEGDRYEIEKDTAFLFFTDQSSINEISLNQTFRITEDLQEHQYWVTTDDFHEVQQFQLDIFLPRSISNLSVSLHESLLESNGSYQLFKIADYDYKNGVSIYRLAWSGINELVSVPDSDTLFQLSWTSLREYSGDPKNVRIHSRYFANGNKEPIPSKILRSNVISDFCPFVSPSVGIITEDIKTDRGESIKIPVSISTGRNHKISAIKFDFCISPLMGRLVGFESEQTFQNADIQPSSYILNEQFPCMRFSWNTQENFFSQENDTVLLGHFLIDIRDDAPLSGQTLIDPHYVINQNSCEQLVDLGTSSSKIHLYPYKEIMTFSLDSIYGKPGEIKNITLSLNEIHHLRRLNFSLEIDTQLIEINSFNKLDLDHPWNDQFIFGLTFSRTPRVISLNLPKLDSSEIGVSLDLANIEILIKEEVANCKDVIRFVPESSIFITHEPRFGFSGNQTAFIQFRDAYLCNEGVSNSEIDHSTISLYPNPATDQVTLSYPDNLQVEKIYLRDLSGRIIQQWEGRQEQLDVRGLQGLYFVELVSNHSSSIEKLVVLQH